MRTLLLILALLPSAVCAEWTPVYTPLKGACQLYSPTIETFWSREDSYSARFEFAIPDKGDFVQLTSVPTAHLDIIATEIYNGFILHRDENIIVISVLLHAKPTPSKQWIFTLYPRERAGFVTTLQAPHASYPISSYSACTVPLMQAK